MRKPLIASLIVAITLILSGCKGVNNHKLDADEILIPADHIKHLKLVADKDSGKPEGFGFEATFTSPNGKRYIARTKGYCEKTGNLQGCDLEIIEIK